MSDVPFEQFRSMLAQRNQVGELRHEVLRHEMSATINRHRLTGQQEGLLSFNTSQLCWLTSLNPDWTRGHFLVLGLFLSSLIDDEYDIFEEALKKGVFPDSWTWISWANGFQGNEEELIRQLSTIVDSRERCGAVCLATRTCPQAIGSHILGQFCDPSLAKVYHRLLMRALNQPNCHKIAANELKRLANHLEVLFSCDTDSVLSVLVQASDLDHPEVEIRPFKDAAGDLTRTAIARRHLERGRAAQALEMMKDLRFLSPAYDQAIVIAALAALESGKHDLAEFYSRNINDDELRLKILTRLAQATGDAVAEIDALSQLYERPQPDAQVFVQLIKALMRTERNDLIIKLCAEAQERFSGDQVIDSLVKRFLVGR